MILDEIVNSKRLKLMQQKKIINDNQMKELALKCDRKSISFYNALSKDGLSIIGEFKKASPSMGVLNNNLNLIDRIDKYNNSMDAISCLTEEDYFNGSIEYLKEIRKISELPIIRKDFIIDSYQVYEAKIIGADAILLIVAILDDNKMKELYDLAYKLDLDVLLEVHNEEELERAFKINPKIIGINNRNLKDFSITLQTSKKLVNIINEKCQNQNMIIVSESGILNIEDVEFLRKCKVDAFLVGRAFMESKNPEEVACQWKNIYLK